jgi:hypothetical protein
MCTHRRSECSATSGGHEDHVSGCPLGGGRSCRIGWRLSSARLPKQQRARQSESRQSESSAERRSLSAHVYADVRQFAVRVLAPAADVGIYNRVQIACTTRTDVRPHENYAVE